MFDRDDLRMEKTELLQRWRTSLFTLVAGTAIFLLVLSFQWEIRFDSRSPITRMLGLLAGFLLVSTWAMWCLASMYSLRLDWSEASSGGHDELFEIRRYLYRRQLRIYRIVDLNIAVFFITLVFWSLVW